MKNLNELYEELENNNELNFAWQEAKKESKKIKKIIAIICTLVNIFFIMIFLKSRESFSAFSMIIFAIIINMFVVIIVNALLSKKKNQYNETYKNIVIPKIMSNFYDNLEYFPQKPMPECIYKKPKYESYNKYKSEDYFEAQIDNKYTIKMAEVLSQKEEKYKDSEGKTHTKTVTKFYGLFAKILMKKSIKSELRITQNGELLFDKRLKMDSSEFEKYFDVTATDKIVGMQLLTADVMEELVDFEKKTKIKFDVYINENKLYLRFHSGEMFEPAKIKKGILDKNTMQKYFYILKFTYNLSKRLMSVVNETQI